MRLNPENQKGSLSRRPPKKAFPSEVEIQAGNIKKISRKTDFTQNEINLATNNRNNYKKNITKDPKKIEFGLDVLELRDSFYDSEATEKEAIRALINYFASVRSEI